MGWLGQSALTPIRTVCQECAALRLGVPGMCQGQAGLGLGKRCKSLINKPMSENPRVGGSIPPLATTISLIIKKIL